MNDAMFRARLEALESRLRRTRLVAAGALCAALVLPVLAFGPAQSLLRADRVEAREIDLIDEDGAVRVTLRATSDGGVVRVLDGQGDDLVALGERADSRKVVHVGDNGRLGWGVLGEFDSDDRRRPVEVVGGAHAQPAPEPDAPVEFGGVDLRPGVEATPMQRTLATELAGRGWVYIMPKPKSRTASWENRDERTTWYNGYWKNNDTNVYSRRQPEAANGYAGDGQRPEAWSRGGAPRTPTVIEWLCSNDGGIAPQ